MNFTPDIIEKYPNKPWDWSGIAHNPSINAGFVSRHPEILQNVSKIAENDFIYDDIVCQRSMEKDSKVKHDFIVNTSGMVPDLAEIVAEYCSYM
jgi:hypothetical protein